MTRAELLANGICPKCKKPNDRPDKGMCSECAKKHSDYKKSAYEYRKLIHVCVRCGHNKAEPNRVLCMECLERERIRDAKRYSREKAALAKRKQAFKRISNGMCPECGTHRMVNGGTCNYCRAKHKRYRDSKRNDITRSERPYYGLCYICGKPIVDNTKSVCPECYETRLSTLPNMFSARNNAYWKSLEKASYEKHRALNAL